MAEVEMAGKRRDLYSVRKSECCAKKCSEEFNYGPIRYFTLSGNEIFGKENNSKCKMSTV
jgi:hypothetical protein